MNLRLTQRPVTSRRLGGLALSVPLHVCMLMLAASGIVGLPPVPTEPRPEVQVSYVSFAPKPAIPREPMLVDQAELFTDVPADSATLSLPDFEFNITKISTRRTVPFPFIAADLGFLETLRRETALSQRWLVVIDRSRRASGAIEQHLGRPVSSLHERNGQCSWVQHPMFRLAQC